MFVIVAKDDKFPEIWKLLLPCSNDKAFEKWERIISIIFGGIKVSKTRYDEKKSTAKWLIKRQSLCGCYRFRETHEVMRQRPDPMIGGLVYETLSLVCAEFQIASVGGSSHQSL